MIDLPNISDEPLAVRTLYPNPEYYNGWNEAIQSKKQEVKNTVDDADIVGITHTDADGYGCEVMLRSAYPDKRVRVVTASENGPTTVDTVGDFVNEYASHEARVFIMDLCPDEGKASQFISPFHDFRYVHVIDHHDEWDEHTRDVVGSVASLEIDKDKCATQITRDLLVENPSAEMDDFAELTADHDLWIKERREESDALADLATESDRQEYVELALEYGSDVLVESEQAIETIERKQNRRNRKAELALNRTTFSEIQGYNVAITYGQCDPSHTGEALYEDHGADLAAVLYPNGNLSLRAHEDTPVAGKVANELGGGGHPCAAGASIRDFVQDDVGYHAHWSMKGSAARTHLEERLNDILAKIEK